MQCNFKGFSQRSSATKTQTVTQNRCLTALEKPKNIFYRVICQINAIEQVNYFVQLKRQFSSIKSCGYAILTFNRFLCTGLKFRPVEVDVHLMKYPFDIFSTILCFIQESCKSKNFHFLLFTYYYCHNANMWLFVWPLPQSQLTVFIDSNLTCYFVFAFAFFNLRRTSLMYVRYFRGS